VNVREATDITLKRLPVTSLFGAVERAVDVKTFSAKEIRQVSAYEA